MKFSAVIVTRGDVDLGPVIAPIVPLADEIIIRRGHNGVWERWEAILGAKYGAVFTCDDDAIIDIDAFIKAIGSDANLGRQDLRDQDLPSMWCNMPEWKRREYQDGTALVGWGAFIPKQTAEDALNRYRALFPIDDLFRRECDRVFTGLSKLELVEVPFWNMPWSDGPDRMCRAPGDPAHAAARISIRNRIESIRVHELIHRQK